MSGHNLPPVEEEDDFGIPPVVLDTNFPTWIALDGLPKVTKDKLEKLGGVVRKVLGSIGEVRDFIMPFDETTNTTKGFAFVEYAKPEHAATAVGKLHGYALDKVHTFKVSKLSDLDLLDKLADEYQAPDVASEPPASENLYEYLLNQYAQDQYLTFSDVCTEIFLNGVSGDKARGLHRKTEWTEKYFQWSPHGTYLITLHQAGVYLWGGPDFKRLKKFPHVGVDLVDISPCENYLITTSQKPLDGNADEAIIVWDIRSGQRLRGFPRYSPHWPAFRWSHDDKYFARLHQGLISVFETPSMKLLENKSVKLHGPIQDFVWSPAQNCLAAWVPEANNVPARVVLLRVPDRKELAQKNLFNVVDCKLHWQPQGEFLCVKVDRLKAKKQNTTFELFRVREKDVPVEALELEDFVLAFAWEPRGQRFAIVHADVANAPRPNVSFYTMAGKKVKHTATLDKRPCNALFWSPMGRFILLAGFRNHNGALEFYDSQENLTMSTTDHTMLTNVEWDPTGRYVATAVSFWTEKLENGFKLWSFNGRNIAAEVKSKLYQFLWRPRPPTLLTKDQEKLVQKNFKEYSERYKKEDEEKISIQREEKRRRKEMQRVELDRIMALRVQEWDKEREKRRQIRGYASEDENDWDIVEEVVEEVVEVQEEVVDE